MCVRENCARHPNRLPACTASNGKTVFVASSLKARRTATHTLLLDGPFDAPFAVSRQVLIWREIGAVRAAANIAGSCFRRVARIAREVSISAILPKQKKVKVLFYGRRKSWPANESSGIISDRLLARQAQEEEAKRPVILENQVDLSSFF